MICEPKHCTGCGACANCCPTGCITMQPDEKGFLYPQIDETACIQCNLCRKTCPALAADGLYHAPNERCYAAFNQDEQIRKISSSGGVFSAVADLIFQQDGIVFGAAFDEHFKVLHRYADRQTGVAAFRGSKYLQSEIGNSYQDCKQFLDQGRQVVFTGTPCQIAGLRKYLKKEYPNLLTIDFLCHGVPSYAVVRKYLDDFEKKYKSKIVSFSFRDKEHGHQWAHSCAVKATLQNGKTVASKYETLYFWKSFLDNIYLRDCCYDCQYTGIRRVSDLTIGDFWGIGEEIPFAYSTADGVSFLMINTERGQRCIEKCRLTIQQRTLEEAVKNNLTLQTSFPASANRERFFQNYKTTNFYKLVTSFHKKDMMIWHIKIFVNNLLGDKIYRALKKISGRKL